MTDWPVMIDRWVALVKRSQKGAKAEDERFNGQAPVSVNEQSNGRAPVSADKQSQLGQRQ
jgi:hypothetical protein